MYIYYNKITGEYKDSDTKINKTIKLPYIKIDDEVFKKTLLEIQTINFPAGLFVDTGKLVIKPDPKIFNLKYVTEENYIKFFELKTKFANLNSLDRKLDRLEKLKLDTTSLLLTMKQEGKELEEACKDHNIKIEHLI